VITTDLEDKYNKITKNVHNN